ncbi:MAG TPA: lipase maturation factor family protein [Polyangia bacterium]
MIAARDRLRDWLRDHLRGLLPRDHSGPAVARLFHRLLGLVFLDAWLSLGVQVHVLIGARGLMPIARFLARARHELSFADFPTLFWLGVTDTTLTVGVAVGVVLSLVAIFGRWPRAVAAAQVALYLSFATAARTFLSFQWDNLLVECGFFAIFLPRDRRSPWMHTLFRLILLKLYWESGIAKWQSHLHDWQDGSAMSFYYETAPLPTALAWYMHHAPSWWHRFESWATLAFELGVPFGIFVGSRRVRLACAAILTSFQIINAATANYGFFCYLAAALHVFLLDDADVERIAVFVRARLRLRAPAPAPASEPANRRWRRLPVILVLSGFVLVSAIDAVVSFVDSPALFSVLLPIHRVYAPFRLVNTYHLFGHITRARIEPDFQTTDDGATWDAHELRHKPGDPKRRPDWVAPHQPRVDFQLWFYGLSYRSGAPEYVTKLLERLCRDPDAVQPLFAAPLSPHPKAARIVYWQYHFTTAAERRATAAWWKREPVDVTDEVPCDTHFSEGDVRDDE